MTGRTWAESNRYNRNVVVRAKTASREVELSLRGYEQCRTCGLWFPPDHYYGPTIFQRHGMCATCTRVKIYRFLPVRYQQGSTW